MELFWFLREDGRCIAIAMPLVGMCKCLLHQFGLQVNAWKLGLRYEECMALLGQTMNQILYPFLGCATKLGVLSRLLFVFPCDTALVGYALRFFCHEHHG